jgi:hypothetical protein
VEVTFDFSSGDVLIEKVKISIDISCQILPNLNGGFMALEKPDKVEGRYQSKRKFTTLSAEASIVIDVAARKIASVCILFDEVNFFEKSILESIIIKRFEKKYGISVKSHSPTVGEIGNFSWGSASFLYHHRLGDFSLCFIYND